MEQAQVYDHSWTIGGSITLDMCNQMSVQLHSTTGYVK